MRVLGAYMDLKVDTDKRVRRGYGAWALLKTRLKKSKLSVKRQAQIIRATVMTTMTHAAKSRPWREYEYRALQKVLDRAYRYITKTNLWKLTEEQKNMFDVRKECGAVRVKHEIEKMALEWCGHVLRMKEESLVKQTTKGWLNNKDSKLGKIGGKLTIARYWRKILPNANIDPEYVENRASDRTERKESINAM